jgi:hypothetical protein
MPRIREITSGARLRFLSALQVVKLGVHFPGIRVSSGLVKGYLQVRNYRIQQYIFGRWVVLALLRWRGGGMVGGCFIQTASSAVALFFCSSEICLHPFFGETRLGLRLVARGRKGGSTVCKSRRESTFHHVGERRARVGLQDL